jgi:uncharacterized repeat protein (TIGR03806 family)
MILARVSLLALAIAACGCHSERATSGVKLSLGKAPYEKLSSYRLFRGSGVDQLPNKRVIPYAVSSALFSDYTHKRRFVWVPEGTSIRYHGQSSFQFPVGAVLVKTFSMPHDQRDLKKGERLLETRLLIKTKTAWRAYTYIWNKAQTEAILEIAGDSTKLKWIHSDGKTRSIDYIIPNVNDCKSCHSLSNVLTPIGPKAKHLNRQYKFRDGERNQLSHWTKIGLLVGAPRQKDVPRLSAWDDGSADVNSRARAYLDINCAHCHNPEGLGSNAGLDLRSEQEDRVKLGVFKAPVAAGRGSGGRLYDIVPGHPEQSITIFRMSSRDPGIAMPELGRGQNHDEGVQLIKDWISGLKGKN